MPSNIIRIALIGAGRGAKHYQYIFDSKVCNSFEIVGVCDIDKKAALELADHWNCDFFTKIEDLIVSVNPDLVIILTPSGLHYEHVKNVLNLDCNVLVEKPITMIPAQAIELDLIAQSKGLLLCVAFQNRLNPSITCVIPSCAAFSTARLYTSVLQK